jgi:hypothetical protein
MASTNAKEIGIEALTPALETVLPSATYRMFVSQVVSGNFSRRRLWVAQCPVARCPRMSPVLATTSAPSQMLTVVAPFPPET